MATFEELREQLDRIPLSDNEAADLHLASIEEQAVKLYWQCVKNGCGGCFAGVIVIESDDIGGPPPLDPTDPKVVTQFDPRPWISLPLSPEPTDPREITRFLRIHWSNVLSSVAGRYPDSFPAPHNMGAVVVSDYIERGGVIRYSMVYTLANVRLRIEHTRIVLAVLHKDATPAHSTLPELKYAAKKCAAYIDRHPGEIGETIARECKINFDYFRGKIVPKLYEHGYYNDGGYFPPKTEV